MRKASRGFEFPLPFDPFRLLLAVLENVLWIVLAALLIGALGASIGWFYLGDSYKAPARILKESAPENWQNIPKGPYAPRPLGAEALKIVAYSTEVFDLAGRKLDPPVTGDEVRDRTLFKEITGQDLFEARGISKSGPVEALNYAKAYADALVELTIERRMAEARAARDIYASHLDQKREAVERVSKELLEVSSRHGLFDAAEQTSNQLQELSTLRARRQEAANAVARARAAITVYLGQSWTGPLRAELERMKRESGPSDPEVFARERELADIEAKMLAVTDVDGDLAVRSLAARLPSVVYKELMRLREDLKVEQSKLDSAAALVADAEGEIKALPDKVMAFSDLQANLKDKLATSVLVETRMKDAEFYSRTPPPPVQILQEPVLEDVDHRSAYSKALILGGAGAFLGGVFALGGVLLTEFFRRTVRTPLQAAIATSAVPKLTYPRGSQARGKAELRDFWLRSIGKYLPAQRRFLFPVLGDALGEEKFWEDLFGSLEGGSHRVVFMDFGREPLDIASGGNMLPDYNFEDPHPVSVIDPSRYAAKQIENICAQLPERHILLVRWHRDPDTSLVELCRHIDRYYFVTSSRDAQVADVEYLGSIYRDLLGEADGVVLVERRKPSRARRIVSALEKWFIESRGRSTIAAPGGVELEGAAL